MKKIFCRKLCLLFLMIVFAILSLFSLKTEVSAWCTEPVACNDGNPVCGRDGTWPCCNAGQPACAREEFVIYGGACYAETHCWFPASDCGATAAACNPPPSTVNVTISSSSVRADGSTQYTITATANDASGGSDIGSQYVLIDYQSPGDTSQAKARGYLGWSTQGFPSWGGAYATGPFASSSGGGSCAKYNGYGPQYVNLLSCSTSVSGNSRITVFTVSFNPVFATSGPGSGNNISQWVRDSVGSTAGWNNYLTNFSVVAGCNQSCGYGCGVLWCDPISLTCRNPDCPSEPSCVCPTTTPTPSPTPTKTPTPTPTITTTPTPTPIPPWYKLKNASFNKLSFGIYDPIPASVAKCHMKDPGNPFLIDNDSDNNAGLVISSVLPINYGSGALSANPWYNNNGYSFSSPFTTTNFIEYVKSRKEYKIISSLGDINTSDPMKIFITAGPLVLTNAGLTTVSQDPLILIINGNVTINDTNFNSAGKKLAVLSTGALNINSAVTSMNGIFLATQGIDFAYDITPPGVSTNQLIINGNLISQSPIRNDSSGIFKRAQTDSSKASIFISFDQEYYLSLLPYLSISLYDWQQLQ